MYKLEELSNKKVSDLQTIAKELNIKKFNKLNKEELAYAILDYQAENSKTTLKPIKKQKVKNKNSEKITKKYRK